jgi:hypothetical protein
MTPRRFALVVALGAVSAVLFPARAAAQLINLKTLPVAAGDQFVILPSANLGMGSVGIALDDPLLDPFVNPARGARIESEQVFMLPTYYSISQNAGNAKTLSLGGLFGGAHAFGGATLALQQLQRGDEFFGPVPVRQLDAAILPPNALSAHSARNLYAALSAGLKLSGGWAVGAGALFSDLGAIDGVEHLYALASSIQQSGSMADVRLGALKQTAHGATFEALALYNAFDMTHDVSYVDWVLVDSTTYTWEQRERVEHNEDQTKTLGAHLRYTAPLGTAGWRIGGILTANRKDHPKIPNYEIVQIPRDPGHSNAFDIGLGLAKRSGSTTLGVDLIYQPAWSSTWAEAGADTVTVNGDTLRVGAKTVENEFKFSNAFVSFGVQQAVGPAAFQIGLQLRAYDYHLDQWDNVADTFRRQDEQWMEWLPSWGASIRLTGVEIRYAGRVTTGTGRPGTAWTGGVVARADAAGLANDIVVPASGPLTLQDVSVVTHQVMVSLPIR